MKNITFIAFFLAFAITSAAYATDSAVAPAPAAPAPIMAPAPPGTPIAPAAAIPTPAPVPAPAPLIAAAKKVELQDGAWALVDGDTVKISRDNGKTWSAAPDQTWVAKDGSKLATEKGEIVK